MFKFRATTFSDLTSTSLVLRGGHFFGGGGSAARNCLSADAPPQLHVDVYPDACESIQRPAVDYFLPTHILIRVSGCL